MDIPQFVKQKKKTSCPQEQPVLNGSIFYL